LSYAQSGRNDRADGRRRRPALLWTHVYDDDIIQSGALTHHEPASCPGLDHTPHHFDHAKSLQDKGFCGGSAMCGNWLTRVDLFAALGRFGWHVDATAFDTPDHPHGPALALTATRRD
jgi:hypothetical protein